MKKSSDRKRERFEVLVVEQHVQLRAFVRSLAVDPDWVDDVAQEAFLTAYRQWETFDPSRDFGKWLRGIAANIVRNEVRKDSRRHRLLHSGLADLLLSRQDESRESTVPVTIQAVRECLGKLAPLSRKLVQARYRDEEKAPEIAERFKLTSDNVRQMLVRIRRQIKQCVEIRLLREAERG
ncbi:MAG: sigma-70 family RNA polymerase sigma factor [Isosphaeraceae bacterium]